MERLKRLRRPAREIRGRLDALLARADLALVRKSHFDGGAGPADRAPVLPPGADAYLRPDNPRLVELRNRYRGHPATASSEWSETFIRSQVDLRSFRGDNAYVWQRRASTGVIVGTGPVNYALTTFYVKANDPLELLGRLPEDDLFGAITHDIDGLVVTRELLDSVVELGFLEEELGLSKLAAPTILDIGAGYGRLAHRTTAALEGATYLSTDAIAESTFLCEYYLGFRASAGALAVPLDEIEGTLEGRRIDLAVNVHSFGECPLPSIRWWIDLLAEHDVAHLMIVPNGEELLSKETTGARLDYLPLLRSKGFELVARRPKYAHSRTVQEHGVYPTWHYLLSRR